MHTGGTALSIAGLAAITPASGTVGPAGAVSFVLLALIKKAIGLRVTESEEAEGLDLTQHEEMGYDL